MMAQPKPVTRGIASSRMLFTFFLPKRRRNNNARSGAAGAITSHLCLIRGGHALARLMLVIPT
jgi:hypothetical protein